MKSYRKFNSRRHDSRHHSYHTYRNRQQRYWNDEEKYESHRFRQRHHKSKNSGEKNAYEYNMVSSTIIKKPSQVRSWTIRKSAPPPPSSSVPLIQEPRGCNQKLITDPFFGKLATKLYYRYDGTIPDYSSYPELIVNDSRTSEPKYESMTLPIELPVPKFKLGKNYIGHRPEVEVTFSNLNFSIDNVFLTDLIMKFGKVELLQIFYHPVTKKHLGLAKTIFEEAASAKSCVQSLNETSIMGKIVNVFLDPFAVKCKIMFDQMIEVKSKPVPETNHSVTYQDRQFVKFVKSKEKHSVQSQSEEKSLPHEKDNSINFSYITPTTSDLLVEQSYSSKHSSMDGTAGFSEDYPNPYNRLISNVSPVPNNNLGQESKLDLHVRIENFPSNMSSQVTSVEPAYSSTVKKVPGDAPQIVHDTDDDDLNFSLLPPLGDNINQSDLDEKVYNKEKTLPALSIPPSPYFSIDKHDFFVKCFGSAVDPLNVTREKEKLEPKCFLNNSLRNGFSVTMHDSLHSDDESVFRSPKCSTLDGAKSLCANSSGDEQIIENDPNIPIKYSQLSNHHPQEDYNSLQDFCKPESSCDGRENRNLSTELQKNLLNAVLCQLKIVIKRDLMKKIRNIVAFNTLDQWWEEAERLSKSTSVTNEEPKSTQLAPNLNSILEAGTECLETMAQNDLGLEFRAAIPKMPSFCKKKNEPPLMESNELQDIGSDQEKKIVTSDNEAKNINDDEVTRATFVEQEHLESKQFDKGKNTSTSEPSVHSFSEEESSFCDDNSCDGFIWQNKLKQLCKSVTIKDFDRFRELTPVRNKMPIAIDHLSSSDEEGSFIKYKRLDRAVKRSIEDENLNKPFPFKKRLLYEEKTPTEKNQQAYRPPLSCWEFETDRIDQIVTSQPIQDATMLFQFLIKGIDLEDINYLKQSYDLLSTNNTKHHWLNKTHWVSHPATAIPDQLSRTENQDEWKVHDTGCARTEGYYKVDSKQKANHKYHFGHTVAQSNCITGLKRVKESTVKMVTLSREARNNQRRLLRVFGVSTDSDLFKFKLLKFHKKQIKFGKSAIHEWGLFALESIAADEMVIEYVGQIIRSIVADTRERQYMATGIGSSYFFRRDFDSIVDSTKCGNMARFINHSCNPNCYAKVVQIEGQKKIIIYSKQPIAVNEEITYNYKFAFEDTKIPCLCGTHCCRGTMN